MRGSRNSVGLELQLRYSWTAVSTTMEHKRDYLTLSRVCGDIIFYKWQTMEYDIDVNVRSVSAKCGVGRERDISVSCLPIRRIYCKPSQFHSRKERKRRTTKVCDEENDDH